MHAKYALKYVLCMLNMHYYFLAHAHHALTVTQAAALTHAAVATPATSNSNEDSNNMAAYNCRNETNIKTAKIKRERKPTTAQGC
jgi:hypothetical protein